MKQDDWIWFIGFFLLSILINFVQPYQINVSANRLVLKKQFPVNQALAAPINAKHNIFGWRSV